ncbi:hypothetical protein H9L39_16966 [Fusarium oxysporum f. sp. albedinis]|nr:hypothetical protein H9L39_16966 [Fusarium oxysporum f. sp. albedinis]
MELYLDGDDVQEGAKLAQYSGSPIRGDYLRRLRKGSGDHIVNGHYVVQWKHGDLFLDAENESIMAKYANHSCQPNCELQEWEDSKGRTLFLVASKLIKRGDPITFEYNPKEAPTSVRVRFNEQSQYSLREPSEDRISSIELERQDLKQQFPQIEQQEIDRPPASNRFNAQIAFSCMNGAQREDQVQHPVVDLRYPHGGVPQHHLSYTGIVQDSPLLQETLNEVEVLRIQIQLACEFQPFKHGAGTNIVVTGLSWATNSTASITGTHCSAPWFDIMWAPGSQVYIYIYVRTSDRIIEKSDPLS